MVNYVDLQVNGAFGVDFNSDSLTFEQFEFACDSLGKQGTRAFLPTVITDSIENMIRRIKRIVEFANVSSKLRNITIGLHVEGPFISGETGFVGTHPKQHVKDANMDDAIRLIDAGQGMVRMLTLAPERDPGGCVTKSLTDRGIRIFAGHTNASRQQLSTAMDQGLCGFTHLGNGCPHMLERHDNIIQRVLSLRQQLYITLIADGVHLPDWLLDHFVDIIGYDRAIIISDAMSAAGMPPGEYSIGGQPITVDANRRTSHRDHGYLAGSASTLSDMFQRMSHSNRHDEESRNRLFCNNALNLLRIEP